MGVPVLPSFPITSFYPPQNPFWVSLFRSTPDLPTYRNPLKQKILTRCP